MTEGVSAKWDEYDEREIGVGSWTDQDMFGRRLKPPRVLEVGCGRGKFIDGLPTSLERFGVDLSPRAIESARRTHPDINFTVASAQELPFADSSFDTVYAIEVIEHLDFPVKFLSEARRILKSNGVLFVQTPNYPIKRLYDIVYWLRGRKPTWRDDYTHVSPFSARSLRSVIERAGFAIDEVRTRNILFENQLQFLKRSREQGSPLSLFIGQKTVVAAHKS